MEATNNLNYSITRTNLNEYTIESKDNLDVLGKKANKAIIEIDPSFTKKYSDNEIKYYIINNIAEGIINRQSIFKTKNEIKIKKNNWKLNAKIKISTKKETPFIRLFGIIHKQGKEEIRITLKNAKLTQIIQPGIHNELVNPNIHPRDPSRLFNIDYRLYQNKIDCRENPEMIPCSEKQISEGIKGIFPMQRKEEHQRSSYFSHPFTTLASLAFQRYEKEFKGLDNFTPEKCEHCLVLKDEQLMLLPQNHKEAQKPNLNQDTVRFFQQLLISEFGEDKINYICYNAGINFKHLLLESLPLTPEHIYRINVALGIVETDDCQLLLDKLPDLAEAFKSHFNSIENLDNISDQFIHKTLLSINQNLPKTLTLKEIKGIVKAAQEFAKNDEKNRDLPSRILSWLEQFKGISTISALDPEEFTQLMNVLSIDAEDKEKIFTGRAICGPINSGYTLAETKASKPWINQQEFLHCSESLNKKQAWELYYEKLAFVICKKQPVYLHPDLGYKCGAVFPAPKDAWGNSRWYKISQVVHNGYGTMCYTLEPVCKDPSLPLIKLYRSTASDPSALFSSHSVRSDINPLNPPGYEGIGRADEYEESLINSQTIPVWVGYAHLSSAYLTQAKDAGKVEAKKQFLKKTLLFMEKANNELKISEELQAKNPSLSQIIKKYNHIINDLYLNRLIDRLDLVKIRKYSRGTANKQSEAEFAGKFIKTLEKIDENPKIDLISQEKRYIKKELIELIKALREFRIQPEEIIESESIKNFEKIKQETLGLINNNQIKKALKILNQHKTRLDQIAIKQGETLDSKQKRSLSFVGHSLGGACAQVHTVRYLSEKRRIPCPGKACTTAAFDAPGIRKDDVKNFNAFLTEHSDLIKETGIQFQIYQQQEVNDFVTAPGIHLGSTDTKEEEENLLKTCQFTGALFKRLPKAINPYVSEAKIAHETQFLEGTEGVDYNKKIFTPSDLGILKNYETIGKDKKGRHKKEIVKQGRTSRKFDWQYPLKPQTTEKLRSCVHLLKIADKHLDNEMAKIPSEMIKFVDERGIFAVNERGIIKNQLNFELE